MSSGSSHADDTLAGDGPRRPAAAPATGDRIGRYIMLGPVGEGGMGVVLAAYDPELGRKVAIKLLHARPALADGGARRRLQREAQAMAQLSHPNVVAVHDVGEHEGRVFLAMEFVDGRTLGSWLKTAGPSMAQILAAFTAAGRGLAAAHAKGLIHRDFKPENAMIGDDGRVRVMDFGLVRAASDLRTDAGAPADSSSLDVLGPELTGAGPLLGTPAYMSPEQYARQEITASSDQFSFCVALYEALYKQRPFAGSNVAEWMIAATVGRMREPPPEARVPAWIRAVVVRGLAPRPQYRWSSMHDLLQALADDPTRRRRFIAAAGVVVVLAGAGVGAWLVHREGIAAACEEEAAAIDRHWNDARRESIAAAFVATGASGAESSWSRAAPYFDTWAQQWSGRRRELCVAGTVEHTLDATTLERARTCLDERAAVVATILEQLDTPDQNLVHSAITIAAKLPLLAPCSDTRTLALQPPLADPELLERTELSRVRGLVTANDLDAALALATDLAREVGRDGRTPLHARAQFELGRVHAARSEYAEALPLLEDAYHIALAAGDDMLALQAAIEVATWVEHRDGNTVAAHLWVRQAETLVTRLQLDDHPEVPLLLGIRAQLALQRGDVDEGLEALERSLEIRTRLLGADHPGLSTDIANLGLALWQAGRMKEAREQLERAIDLDEQTYGPDHPELAGSLTGLGIVALESGDAEASLSALQRALEIREAALGPDHHLVGQALLNVANAQDSTGDPAFALRTVDRALVIFEKTLGPDHRDVAGALDGRGLFLAAMGDFESALASHEKALAIREKHGDPNEMAISLSNLALVLLDLDRPTDALPAATRSRELRERQVGADHPDVAVARELVGRSLAALGQHEQALAEYRAALPVLESVFGPDHPRVQLLHTLIEHSEHPSE